MGAQIPASDDDKSPVTETTIVPVPMEAAWRALTDVDEMRQWYFPQIKDFQAVVGFHIGVSVTHEGNTYNHLWTVKEVVPYSKISYRWEYEGYEGTSLVAFIVTPSAAGASIELIHSGLDSFDSKSHPELKKENFKQGWSAIISQSLKSFLSKSPSKEIPWT